jgi:two-component sensor histidine kinase
MIKESLQEARTSANDITALSILHLLVSETGGFDEEVFDVHLEGLVRIVHQRGGLENLGIYGRLASFLTVFVSPKTS